MANHDVLHLTVQIVSAQVEHNTVQADELPDLIQSVFAALNQVDSLRQEFRIEAQLPAVSIKKSVFPSYIICLEDGRQMKMLKRHLQNAYGLSPAKYRAKWGLPNSYPMVAPDYAARRSALAIQIGLGRIPGQPKKVVVNKIPEGVRGKKINLKATVGLDVETVK